MGMQRKVQVFHGKGGCWCGGGYLGYEERLIGS
jgi:hypothetical protein